MKPIGLIGGVSWTSTMEYYRRLNSNFDVEILIHSFNFADILKHQKTNNIEEESRMLITAAMGLQKAGAAVILICSNTTSKTSEIVAKCVDIPLVNVIEATAKHIHTSGFSKVGLLATTHTVNNKLYNKYLGDVEIILPTTEQQEDIHNIIYKELCNNIILMPSKMKYLYTILDMCNRGVEAVILGCTEIPLLISKDDLNDLTLLGCSIDVPIIDTITVHIDALGKY